ncbi:MAG: hypothetical protein V7785_18500 [Bermanella sp.]
MTKPTGITYLQKAIELMLFTATVSFIGPVAALQNMDQNLRAAVDVSSKMVNYQSQNQTGSSYIVGIDIHKVFSHKNGDVGTLILQAYMTKLDNQVQHPGFFKDKDDEQLVYRIVSFNLTSREKSLPNLKLGHIELPYGLEHTINTNGTLYGFQQGSILGIKADWGMSLNKQMQRFEYEFSATSGGGQDISSDKGNHVYAARVGSLRNNNQVFGVSVYESSLQDITRRRVGLDFQHYWRLYGLLGQIDVGDDNGGDVRHLMMELNWRGPVEMTRAYLQAFHQSKNVATQKETRQGYTLGLQLDLIKEWDLSAQYQWDSHVFSAQSKQRVLSAQIRYRF